MKPSIMQPSNPPSTHQTIQPHIPNHPASVLFNLPESQSTSHPSNQLFISSLQLANHSLSQPSNQSFFLLYPSQVVRLCIKPSPSIYSSIHHCPSIYLASPPSIYPSLHRTGPAVHPSLQSFIGSFIYLPSNRCINSFYVLSSDLFIHRLIHPWIHPSIISCFFSAVHSDIHQSFHTAIH